MGDTNALSIQVTVDASGAVTGLKVAGKSVDGAALAMQQSFAQAARGSDGLTDSLREFKKEATQASRVANFYARDLGEIIPIAGSAGVAVKGLLSAALAGGGLASGFQLAVVALNAIKEATEAAAKEAQKLRDVHIDVSAEITKGLTGIQRGLDGDTTAVQKFKQGFADGTTGELIKANKEASELLQKSGGIVDFLRYMGSVFAHGSGPNIKSTTTGIADDLDKTYSGVIARTKDFDAQKRSLAEKEKAENKTLDEKESIVEEQITAQTADAITKIKLDADARVRSLRVQTQGSDKETRARAESQITAIETDAATRVTRMREDKELELANRMQQLRSANSAEDIKIQIEGEAKAAQLRLQARRTTDPEFKAMLLAQATAEVEQAKQTAARVREIRLAEFERTKADAIAKGDEALRTMRAKQLDDAASLEQQITAIRAGLQGQRYSQEYARASQEITKRAAEEIAIVRKAQQAHVIDFQQMETMIAGINRKASADRTTELTKEYKKSVEGFVRPLESAFTGMVKSMISGTKSVGDALKEFGTSILSAVVDGIIKVGAEWVATKVAGILATNALATNEITGAATAAAANKAANISSTQANIATAMSGAASAMASIPFVGPELAVAAAAAMFGVMEGMTAPLFAASGGFDVPAGINPKTQLHEQEMVLPKSIAVPLRQSIAGGQMGGGTTHNWTVYALDAKSFGQMLGQPEYRRQVSELVRSNRWG